MFKKYANISFRSAERRAWWQLHNITVTMTLSNGATHRARKACLRPLKLTETFHFTLMKTVFIIKSFTATCLISVSNLQQIPSHSWRETRACKIYDLISESYRDNINNGWL